VRGRETPQWAEKPLISKALDKELNVLYLFSLTPKVRVAVNCIKVGTGRFPPIGVARPENDPNGLFFWP
jgi:hypothetical protein